MSALSAPLPRHGLVLADLLPGSLARDVALVVGGAALTGLAAVYGSVPIPGSPVPLTLQGLAVLTVGAALGWQRAALSMLLYVGAGMAGMPWFAGGASGGAGLPTFGYLVGFVVAAVAVGALARRGADRSVWQTALTMVLGIGVIYALGVPYLAWSLDMGLSQAVTVGLVPFLVGDAIKVVVAAGLLPASWWLMDRLHRS